MSKPTPAPVSNEDLNAAARLFGWALTLWAIGATAIAATGHARAQQALEGVGVPSPWAYTIMVSVLGALSALLVYSRVSDSRKWLVFSSLCGALFCAVDATLVMPILLSENAGIEIANWGLNFILFMLSAVVNSRRVVWNK